jgi:hypothetical protein
LKCRGCRVRAEGYPLAVVAYYGAFVDDLDLYVVESRAAGVGVFQDAFGVRDLKDPALRIIEKKYLDIAVGVSRILGRKVPARFKNDKSSVSAH